MSDDATPVRISDCYTERRRLCDGSERWLWIVYRRLDLWDAGLADTYEGCRQPLESSWLRLLVRQGLAGPVEQAAPEANQVVDLDVLGEPGMDEDDSSESPWIV